MVQARARPTHNGRPIGSRLWSIEQRHFHWYWTTPNSELKVTPLFQVEYLRNGTRNRHSYNGILIGTYTCPTQGCHFEWPRVILNDLAKYSMTRSIARSLCNSWTSCCVRLQPLYEILAALSISFCDISSTIMKRSYVNERLINTILLTQ